MRSLARACHYVVTTAVVAGLGVVLAPTAAAVPTSVALSSFDAGPVGVSGTVTLSPSADMPNMRLLVGVPSSEYTTSGGCSVHGVTAAINGAPISGTCMTYPSGGFGIIQFNASTAIVTSDVITLTWGAGLVSRNGAASATAFQVASNNSGPPNYASVTPTLASSSSSSSGSSSAPDMTMWHQSIGRATSAASCPPGYTPSWAQWPNGNQGGWVCNREVLAYQPDSGT
jgi:hypothetical protein